MKSSKNAFASIFILAISLFSTGLSQWKQVNGPECAVVNELTRLNDKIYAACRDHLYYTSDSGRTWIRDPYGFTSGGILSVTGKKNIVLAGSAKGVLYRSSDFGGSWGPVDEMISKQRIRNLVWDEDTVYACTEAGVYQSRDLGIHWRSLNKSLPDSSIFSLAVTDSVMLAGVHNKGVFMSRDRGSHWIQFNNGIESRTVNALTKIDTFYYAGTDSGLYRLSASSSAWTKFDTLFPRIPVFNIRVMDGTVYAATYCGLVISDSSFSSWRFVFNGGSVFITNDVIAEAGKLFIATGLRGVQISSDGGTTWKISGTINKNSFVRFARMKDSTMLASNINGVFISTNEGSEWRDLTTDSVDYIYDGSIQDTVLYAVSRFGLYRRSVTEDRWSPLLHQNAVSVAVQKNRIYAGTWGNGLYYSSNSGATFEVLDSAFLGKIITRVEVIDSTVLVTSRTGIFLSRDYGKHWIKTHGMITDGEIASYSKIDSLYFGASDSYIATLKMNDSVWVPTNMSEDIYAFYNLQRVGKILFVAGAFGVHYTADLGEHWTDAGFSYYPMFSNTWSAYTIMSTNKKLFVGSYESGIWWRNLDEIVSDVQDHSASIPGEYLLHQNYPNPFNPSTRITYELPAAARVTLSVYDMLGREVTELVNEEKSAGQYSVTWNASSFAAGIYFARMNAGDHTAVKKLVLMK